jgi:hypothetical protein
VGTPLSDAYYAIEAAALAALGLWLAVYAVRLVLGGARIHRLDLLIAVPMLLPLLGAYRATVCIGQPVAFGLAAQRAFVACAGVILFSHWLRSGKIDAATLHRALLVMSWMTAIAWTLMCVFVNRDFYVRIGGIVTESAYRGTRFRYDRCLSAYAALYYTIRFVRRPSLRDGVPLLFFLGYILLVTMSRMYAVSFAVVVLAFLWQHSARLVGRRAKYALGAAAVLCLGAGTVMIVPPARQYVATAFGSAFRVVLTGEATAEGSADARIRRLAAAWPSIARHPWLGNGVLSRQGEITDVEILGEHFTPVDVGILGGVYEYGVLGVLALLLPYAPLLRRRPRVHPDAFSTAALCARCFTMYYLAMTVLNNVACRYPAPGLTGLLLVCATLPRPAPTPEFTPDASPEHRSDWRVGSPVFPLRERPEGGSRVG